MRRLSYAHCGSETQLIGETIGQCLDRIADTHPDGEALVSIPQGRRFTYESFRREVNRAAKAFLALGVDRGDRVAIWSINNFEWVVTQYATAKIGAVLVNVNPAYLTHELEYVLRASRAKVLLLIDSYKTSNYLDMFYETCPEARQAKPGRIDSSRFEHLKSVVLLGPEEHPGLFASPAFAALGDQHSDDQLSARERELEFDDIINIQYTSGTTGFPKGVKLTHHNLINNGYWVGEMMNLTPADRVCVPLPFYHCFGMVIGNLGAMTHGATVVIPAPHFNPEATLQAIHDERCTVLHGVPTMFIAQLDHPDFDRYDLTSLRTGIMGGTLCPIDVMNRVIDRMHLGEILIAYGMTESSPVTAITRRDAPIKRRVSTVGQVMPHQEIKIVDTDTGKILPCGDQGEICFRGYHVMVGYDNLPDETAEAIDKTGWLHSGDLGTMDEEGYVTITGRSKEMVIRGGENIYPREIEEFLHTLDLIGDAHVVGVPDPKYGEELLACVMLRNAHGTLPPTTDEFRRMCDGKIAHFKIPRYWLVVDSFPMTVTGKVQKFKIREIAVERLGLEEIATGESARTDGERDHAG